MSRKLTQQEFIDRAFKAHGDKYSYDKCRYTLSTNFVAVVCPAHGDFKIRAIALMRGKGCAKCSAHKGAVAHTTSTFNKKAIEVHGGLYNYSLVKYKNNKEKVEIICKEHGSFWQRPDMHLQGQGCGECWNHNRGWISETVVERSGNSGKDAYLYIVESEELGNKFYKFGICYKHNLHNRIYSLNKAYSFNLIHLLEDSIENCLEFERSVKESCQRYKPKHKFKGHSECFKVEGMI